MANQSAIEKRLEFFSRTRRKFKSLSFSARKRTSKYTCAAGLNRLRENSQKQIPRGKKTPLDCITTLARRNEWIGCDQQSKSREGANVMPIIGCDFHPGLQQVTIFGN